MSQISTYFVKMSFHSLGLQPHYPLQQHLDLTMMNYRHINLWFSDFFNLPNLYQLTSTQLSNVMDHYRHFLTRLTFTYENSLIKLIRLYLIFTSSKFCRTDVSLFLIIIIRDSSITHRKTSCSLLVEIKPNSICQVHFIRILINYFLLNIWLWFLIRILI